MDNSLMTAINRKDYTRAKDQDFQNTKVYKVEGDETTLRYWNSCNSERIDHDLVLTEILGLLLEDEYVCDGTIDDGWNSIMFEIS